MNFRNVLTILGAATAFTAATAAAAPSMAVTNLPIDPQLLDGLAAQGRTQAQIEDFLTTLADIKVYDDHQNPVETARSNRGVAKRYWSAPFFTPSVARSVVGAQQFADHALGVLDEVDDLLGSFSFELKEFRRLQDLRADLQRQLTGVLTALGGSITDLQRASLLELQALLGARITEVEQKISNIVNQANNGANQIGVTLRRSVANAVVLAVARIGIAPTAAEQQRISSDVSEQLVQGLASLRARAANGQFGLRQAIFEAGFTAKQADVLRAYLMLRPDVTTRALAVQSVRARSTAQTLIDQNNQHITRDAPMMIRGVNLGNGGACGSALTCSTLIEYTDIGARGARVMGAPGQATPVLTPVTFEADVRVAEPNFVGSIFCNFKTGWVAQGRADVKDGAIIYDGDLSNKIKYDSIDSGFGGCQVTITEGDRDSAFYHTLMDMDAFYRNLHTQRQQAAKQEKDRYRAQIEAELQFHQRNSQSRSRGGWFNDVFGLFTSGRVLLGLGGFLLGEARDMYWHTTTLDTHSIDEITVRQNYSIRNVTATRKFAFDGLPLVCYTPSGGIDKVMTACPANLVPEADSEVDVGDEACAEVDILGDCIE